MHTLKSYLIVIKQNKTKQNRTKQNKKTKQKKNKQKKKKGKKTKTKKKQNKTKKTKTKTKKHFHIVFHKFLFNISYNPEIDRCNFSTITLTYIKVIF